MDKAQEWRKALAETGIEFRGNRMYGGPLADLYNFIAANHELINRLATTTQEQ